MKAAPVLAALAAVQEIRQTLIHTGQHYDSNMSDVFLQQLDMPPVDLNLGVGSGSHARQTAEVMARFEPVVTDRRPDLVLVYGDVNSTMAAALVCAKLGVRIGHVEAGLRSRDRSMPEEINRLITDQLSDLLFTPSEDADENLRREGIDGSKIHRVGNVMIDTLTRLLPRCISYKPHPLPARYALVTLHRPSNVDDLSWLKALMVALDESSHNLSILFPVHPRTRQRISELELPPATNSRVCLMDPKPYLEFLALQQGATLVITDSGGMQEETTFLGIPCLTLRDNTERPITVSRGTNTLIGRDITRLKSEIQRILAADTKKVSTIPLWDGHAADRIAKVITTAL